MGALTDTLSLPRPSWLKRIRSFEFHLTRRVLFWWIKPTILGCSAENLCLSPDDNVCYVLQFRSLADLLVVDKACETAGLPRPTLPMKDIHEDRAFFFLGRSEGTLGRKSLRMQSARMLRLFEHQSTIAAPIKVVPVSLFWGHQPDKEQSPFKLLFSENWSATSRFKKLLAIIFHPHHILVQFSPPLLIGEFIAEQSDRQLQVRKLMRVLRVHFNRQKQAILGPDLSHRRTLIASMMSSDEVTEAIAKEAVASGIKLETVEKKALRYANEIASDQSYRVIRFFHVLLTWLWNKLYDGIDVYNIDEVKSLAESHEIVYTPCHRSHIDYLLLSYVLYHNGLTPPHVAAGINLNVPVAGPLLRRAGAFFMRRSFSGDSLYKAVFDEYLHLVFTRGYSVEYFIEGGRSRTGRTLPPRTGMLSMTMRSFQRDASRPMALMPVYFSYERVIEAPTYMSELAGRDKKQESFFDILKIFGVFKHSFGKVSVNFGEPVLMGDFLDRHLPDWASPEGTNHAEFSDSCIALSRRLAANINGAAVLNPVNLAATALLATSRQAIEKSRLYKQLDALRYLATGVPGYVETVVTTMGSADIVSEAERVAGIGVVHQPFGDIIVSSPELAILLTWYRNNTMHLFALPSFIARILRTRERVSVAMLKDSCRTLYPFFETEFFLKWSQQEIDAIAEWYVDRLCDLGLACLDAGELTVPEPASEAFAMLSDLGEIIEPTLERFYVVTSLLAGRAETDIKLVEADAGRVARQMSSIYSINSPEFFEPSLFSTFISTLRTEGIIETHERSIIVREEKFLPVLHAAEATLPPDVRYNVLQAIGRVAAGT